MEDKALTILLKQLKIHDDESLVKESLLKSVYGIEKEFSDCVDSNELNTKYKKIRELVEKIIS